MTEEIPDKITFYKDDNNLFIRIPNSILVSAASQHPEAPCDIRNMEEFKSGVIEALENGLGSEDSGLTGFQELLDKAVYEVAVNSDSVELKIQEP